MTHSHAVMAKQQAAPFAPSDVAGLHAWWDASDAATITESGGAVSGWADKSASGTYDLSQATAAAKPTTGANTLNGLNVLTFDGGDYLGFAGSAGLSVSTATLFIVWSETTQVNVCGVFTAYHTTGDDYDSSNMFILTGGNGESSRFQLYRKSAAAEIAGVSPTPAGVWVARTAAAALSVWQNGGTGVTSSPVAVATGTPGGGFLVGTRYLSGAITAGFRLNGRVAEICLYNSTLSSTDMNLVGNHLATKWGFTWTNI